MGDILIKIRQVTENDIATLSALSGKTFHDAFAHLNKAEDMEGYLTTVYSEANLRQEFNQPGSQFYFAELDGQVAGYMKLNRSSSQTEFQDDNSLEVQRIYVLADFQGKQIGEQLINFAVNQARELQCEYIWLGVWEHNNNAIRFYERHGFAKFSQHDFMLGTDLQTDILMKKAL